MFYIVIGNRACLTKEGPEQLVDLKDYKLSKDEYEKLEFSSWQHTTALLAALAIDFRRRRLRSLCRWHIKLYPAIHVDTTRVSPDRNIYRFY